MRATLARQTKGFWGRSYDELKRLSGIALRSEGIKGPSGPYELQSFDDPASVSHCKLMTDEEIGGFSVADIEWAPMPPSHAFLPSSTSASPPLSSLAQGYIRFHGTISTRLPTGRPDVKRTGYAAWRTADRLPTMFGRSLWDVDSFAYLALRVRSDGRSYMVNVQTDSMVAPTDLHQHRLFARRPGQWETVVVPWSDFVRTNHGYVVEPQTELLRQKVRSVGMGLTDRVPGPFELSVARLWATNNPNEAEEARPQEFQEVEEKVAAEAAAAITSQQQLRGLESDVTVNIAFDPATASSPTSPSQTQSQSQPPPPSEPAGAGALRNKKGRTVRWETVKQPPQEEQPQ